MDNLGVSSEEKNWDGPDFFGYHKCQVVELFSQDHDFFEPGNPDPNGREPRNGFRVPSSLFGNGVGAMLSDFKRERLKSILRRAVSDLSAEADKMMGPVLRTEKLLTQRRKRVNLSRLDGEESEEGSGGAHKKLKTVHSSTGQDQAKVNDDVQILIEDDNSEVDMIMMKFSDELSAKLEYMEKQLEELLDSAMSKCSVMTLAEKKHLQKMINALPRKNLERIAELVDRNKLENEKSPDEIFVDLEKESNVTLWRMYYYAKAVENAKKLAQ